MLDPSLSRAFAALATKRSQIHVLSQHAEPALSQHTAPATKFTLGLYGSPA